MKMTRLYQRVIIMIVAVVALFGMPAVSIASEANLRDF